MKKRILLAVLVLLFTAGTAMAATMTASSTINSTNASWSGAYVPSASAAAGVDGVYVVNTAGTGTITAQQIGTGITANASSGASPAASRVQSASLTSTDPPGLTTGDALAKIYGYLGSATWAGNNAVTINYTISANNNGVPVLDSKLGVVASYYYFAAGAAGAGGAGHEIVTQYEMAEIPLVSTPIVTTTNGTPVTVTRAFFNHYQATTTLPQFGITDPPYGWYFTSTIADLLAHGGTDTISVTLDWVYDGRTMGSTAWTVQPDIGALANATVPIPGAIWLLGSGLIGLFGLRKRFQK